MDASNLVLYRKRLIPQECIRLDDDTICSCCDDLLVTSWHVLRPKPDFAYGDSCYYLKKGWKISRFFREDGTLRYWYCDIVDFQQGENPNDLIVLDLLADVIICPDDTIHVVDLDELADAHTQGLLSDELLHTALYRLSNLLSEVEKNGIYKLGIPLLQKDRQLADAANQ